MSETEKAAIINYFAENPEERKLYNGDTCPISLPNKILEIVKVVDKEEHYYALYKIYRKPKYLRKGIQTLRVPGKSITSYQDIETKKQLSEQQFNKLLTKTSEKQNPSRRLALNTRSTKLKPIKSNKTI